PRCPCGGSGSRSLSPSASLLRRSQRRHSRWGKYGGSVSSKRQRRRTRPVGWQRWSRVWPSSAMSAGAISCSSTETPGNRWAGAPRYAPGGLRLKGTEQAGRSLGITIVSVHFSETSDAERAFTEIRRAKAEAVTVLSDPVTVARRLDITELAARYRVPAIYALREW